MAEPERLYSVARQGIDFEGKPQVFDGWAYPLLQQMRAAVKNQAEMIAVSYPDRMDLTYGSDQDMERGVRAIRFRMDVRFIRAAARARPAVHGKRRSETRRASLRGAFLRLLVAPLRQRSESDRPHL